MTHVVVDARGGAGSVYVHDTTTSTTVGPNRTGLDSRSVPPSASNGFQGVDGPALASEPGRLLRPWTSPRKLAACRDCRRLESLPSSRWPPAWLARSRPACRARQSTWAPTTLATLATRASTRVATGRGVGRRCAHGRAGRRGRRGTRRAGRRARGRRGPSLRCVRLHSGSLVRERPGRRRCRSGPLVTAPPAVAGVLVERREPAGLRAASQRWELVPGALDRARAASASIPPASMPRSASRSSRA